jgi:predicted DNA-binding protein
MPKFKSEQIGFRVSNKFKKQVEKLATDQEMTVAEFLRYLVMSYINNLENSKKQEILKEIE